MTISAQSAPVTYLTHESRWTTLRVIVQSNKLVYEEPVDIETVAKRIADLNQQYTQYAGVRPFGVSLIIAGVDENRGPVVYLTDPTGVYLSFDAIAIGAAATRSTSTWRRTTNPA